MSLRRKKLSVDKVDLAKAKPGFGFKGIFVGWTKSAPFHDTLKTGEVVIKELTFALFEHVQGSDHAGERFKVIADAGLRSALSDAMVSEGDMIEVVKLEKTDIGKGRSMNQYDVFALEEKSSKAKSA